MIQTTERPFTPPKKSSWDNKINYRFRVSLQRQGDADIVFRLAQEENQSAFIRNALRYYIEHEDDILYKEGYDPKPKQINSLNKKFTAQE